MSCCTEQSGYPFGSQEALRATLEADVDLDAQPVHFSIDGGAWVAAAWDGAVGPVRDAVAMGIIETLYRGTHSVRARITLVGTAPIIDLGSIRIT